MQCLLVTNDRASREDEIKWLREVLHEAGHDLEFYDCGYGSAAGEASSRSGLDFLLFDFLPQAGVYRSLGAIRKRCEKLPVWCIIPDSEQIEAAVKQLPDAHCVRLSSGQGKRLLFRTFVAQQLAALVQAKEKSQTPAPEPVATAEPVLA